MGKYFFIAVVNPFLLVCFTSFCQPNPCDVFKERRKEIDSIRREIRTLDQSVMSAAVKRRKDDLFVLLQKKSKLAADLLVKCNETQPQTGPGSFIRKYQIAKYYYDTKDCGKVQEWLTGVYDNDEIKSVAYKNATLNIFASSLFDQCKNYNNAPNEVFLNIVYGGKGLYYNLHRIDSIDNRPYDSEELEVFISRLPASNDSAAVIDAYKKLSPDNTALLRFPFVLVAGPGDYHYNALRPVKTPPDQRAEAGYEDDKKSLGRRTRALKYIADSIVTPYYKWLSSRYYNHIRFNKPLPIYLVGGDFSQPAYDDFVIYCKQIHFRSPGPRVAYYSHFDKSVMAWMPTGGGTLIHEMGHALMDNDFPDAPAWISEGLASLYEEVGPSSKRPRHNYRYYYLLSMQRINHCHLPIRRLFQLTAGDLGSKDAGMLYSAYARYFAMYLFEEHQLERFYRRMRDSALVTPAQQVALLESLTGKSMQTIEKDFEGWFRRVVPPARWQSMQYQIYERVRASGVTAKCD
jgi:hypothetical protein